MRGFSVCRAPSGRMQHHQLAGGFRPAESLLGHTTHVKKVTREPPRRLHLHPLSFQGPAGLRLGNQAPQPLPDLSLVKARGRSARRPKACQRGRRVQRSDGTRRDRGPRRRRVGDCPPLYRLRRPENQPNRRRRSRTSLARACSASAVSACVSSRIELDRVFTAFSTRLPTHRHARSCVPRTSGFEVARFPRGPPDSQSR